MKRNFIFTLIIGFLILMIAPSVARDGTASAPDGICTIATAVEHPQSSFIDMVAIDTGYDLPLLGFICYESAGQPMLLEGETPEVFIPPVILNLSGSNSKQLRERNSGLQYDTMDYG